MTLQEKYWKEDPWRLLVICILLNRTKKEVVEEMLPIFFGNWPITWALADAPLDEVYKVIKHLGFGMTRSVHLKKMSLEYLQLVKHRPPHRLNPMNLTGCGEYAWEAWRMFVLKDYSFEPQDAELNKRMKELRNDSAVA